MRTFRSALAELVATALFLTAVVGSGIMGDRLAEGRPALALLANSVASGAGLAALILAFGRSSGAHLNPLVTLVQGLFGEIPWRKAGAYIPAQLAGALLGVAAANGMFETPVFSISRRPRNGPGQLFAEVVATFGLLIVVRGTSQLALPAQAVAVGSYVTAAYWFASSTAFANPAATLARSMTDTFAGIRPRDVPGFLASQTCGAAAAAALLRWIAPNSFDRREGEGGRNE